MSTDKQNDAAIQNEETKQAPASVPPTVPTRPAVSPEPQAAAAQPATPEALPQQLLDLLAKSNLYDLRGPVPDAEVQKGNALPASVLVTGPAMFEFSALADDRLNTVGEDAGLTEKEVTRFSAEMIGNSKTMLIKASPGGNRTVFEVRRDKDGGGCTANLYELLGPRRLTVASGWRERFDVFSVPKGHPYWPGLLIDLSSPTERFKAPARTKKAKAPKPGPENKDGTGTQPTAPPTEPLSPEEQTEHETE